MRELRGGRWRSTHVLTSRRQERHTYHHDGRKPVPNLCHQEDTRPDHSCLRHGGCPLSNPNPIPNPNPNSNPNPNPNPDPDPNPNPNPNPNEP